MSKILKALRLSVTVIFASFFGVSTLNPIAQDCHSQGKISGKLIFFQVGEKSGNFVDGQGNLERTWKDREKSGNLKINGYGRQSSENLFILLKRGNVHSQEIV